MLLPMLLAVALTVVVTAGLAWPWVRRWTSPPAEKLVATAALSLLAAYLLAWAIFVVGLPQPLLAAIPLLALLGLWEGRRALGELLAHPEVRPLLAGQAIVTAWCVGWLAAVGSYSGGGWAADWFEHWERARFFLERWPAEHRLLGVYAVPARPPLANVLTGALLYPVGLDFARYQLVTTLLGSLCFLPAALLVRRWGGAAAVPVLAALLMASPLFVQNATFAWTKLPAAFFVLAALGFFLRARDADAPRGALAFVAAALAAGILAHYSAGPYAVMLAVLWLGTVFRRPDRWRETLAAAAVGAAVLATWFGWTLAVYGATATAAATSSVNDAASDAFTQAVRVVLNLRDTFVPHFLRPLDTALIAQRSGWGAVRDFLFQCYQVNLPLAFGCVGAVALLREAVRAEKTAARANVRFWAVLVAGTVVLGVATHGGRDHWGLAHICLQALVVLGLAFLAARWPLLGRGWRRAVIAGGVFDFAGGIALHFGLQSLRLEPWLGARHGSPVALNEIALVNLNGKLSHGLAFFADAAPSGTFLLVPLAAMAWLRWRRGGASC
jgi:hypothetical protein